MIELGELERYHDDFAKRRVRVVAISNDGPEDAQANQRDFPHITIVSDVDQKMALAMEVIHPGAGHEGEDTNAPTTFLVDGQGIVRWMKRPQRFVTRYSPQELLAVIDETLGNP